MTRFLLFALLTFSLPLSAQDLYQQIFGPVEDMSIRNVQIGMSFQEVEESEPSKMNRIGKELGKKEIRYMVSRDYQDDMTVQVTYFFTEESDGQPGMLTKIDLSLVDWSFDHATDFYYSLRDHFDITYGRPAFSNQYAGEEWTSAEDQKAVLGMFEYIEHVEMFLVIY